ncbi:hypothetical protein AKJ16_DCAP23025 [Drosera capensis]
MDCGNKRIELHCIFEIEILKRLQREGFSDLMKLRDRQDKVERVLTVYKTSKAGPFEGDRTHVRGEVDSSGALLFSEDLDQQNLESISSAGIRTGTVSRLILGTTVRQKDSLEAEFTTSLNRDGYGGENIQFPLALSKVCYTANVADWFSMVAIPMGGRCKDVTAYADPSAQEKGLTDYSTYCPPVLHHSCGSGIGLIVRKLNAIASLAHFVAESPSPVSNHCFSTCGQIVWRLSRTMRLSLFGLNKVFKSSQQISPQNLVASLDILRRHRAVEFSVEPSAPPLEERISTTDVAFMVESELDESMVIRGWAQMKNSDPRFVQWAVTASDSPEGELGWGLSLGGMIQGPADWDRFQAEASLKFNFGRRFTLQPGIIYMFNGSDGMPAFVVRSSWSL